MQTPPPRKLHPAPQVTPRRRHRFTSSQPRPLGREPKAEHLQPPPRRSAPVPSPLRPLPGPQAEQSQLTRSFESWALPAQTTPQPSARAASPEVTQLHRSQPTSGEVASLRDRGFTASQVNSLRGRRASSAQTSLASRSRRVADQVVELRGTRGGEAGQVVPMVAAAIGIMAVAVLIIALVGQRAVARAQARTAADAGALAAAVAGADVGTQIAMANGADTADISVADHVAFATVTIDAGNGGEMSAQARAEEVILPGADGLAPGMIAAIARAEDLLGMDIPIASGFRTNAQQQALWENRHNNPLPVAVPGTSMHELGLAIDVPSSFVPTLMTVAAQAGLCRPLPVTDPVHFILC